MSQNEQQNNNENERDSRDLGQQIGESVRSALQNGDWSRLKDIGPAISNAVKDIPGAAFSSKGGSHTPARRDNAHPYKNDNTPMWMGSAPKQNLPGPAGHTGLGSIILGSLGTFAFGALAVAMALYGVFSMVSGPFSFGMAGGFAVLTLLSAMVTSSGRGNRKLAKAMRQYYALLMDKKVQTFEDLALATGKTVEEVKKDIRKAMKKGWLVDVRLDEQETCLIYGKEAYQLYLETEKARREREAEEAERARLLGSNPDLVALENFKAEGEECIRKIREANDAIPGEEISGKLAKLEATTAKIFAYVEKHPEKLPDTRKFMNYYLPTTLKLVDKYRQYDQAEIQVASIVKAKKEIEGTLDTIDSAFLNMLDNLYQDDTLDVSTDIEVLQTMLEQEGLTGKKFTIESDKEALTL